MKHKHHFADILLLPIWISRFRFSLPTVYCLLSTVCLLSTILFLCACSTSIPISVQRRPNLDVAGINRISVLPFETSQSATSYQTVAQYATTAVTQTIRNTGKFTLVDPLIVNDARRTGQSYSAYTDALFTGRINSIAEETTQSDHKRKDGTIYHTYNRSVEVEVTYSITRAKDGSILGPISKKGNVSNYAEDRAKLTPIATMANSAVDNIFSSLYRDLAPYTTTVSRTIEKEPDKALKPEMDAALALVKSRNYVSARQAYLSIWEQNQSAPAAVNAAIMYEATGDTQAAAGLMQRVYSITGNPTALSMLNRLNHELSQQAGLQQFIADSQNPTEKVSTLAFNEISRVITPSAKLWIYNQSTEYTSLVNDVTSNLIAAFIRAGISIIDRQSIDLILAEQNFQVSGYVNDDDIVQLGKLAGANTIVLANITGVASGRRLVIRVLDIETGTVKYQSDTSSQWNV